MRYEKQIVHAGSFSVQQKDGEEGEGTEQVCVPTKAQSAALHHIEAALNDDGVHGGNHRAGDTEENAEPGDRGAVEEYADEETHRDQGAGHEDQEGGSCVQEE